MLKAKETVLQAYHSFSTDYPMMSHEAMEAKAEMDSIPTADTLYQTLLVLQTYANLFESDFVTNGAKYAKSCTYLGMLYKERGWAEASRKYLNKALRMYEMLDVMEGLEMQDRINKVKDLLETL